jgi:hypothetical protein
MVSNNAIQGFCAKGHTPEFHSTGVLVVLPVPVDTVESKNDEAREANDCMATMIIETGRNGFKDVVDGCRCHVGEFRVRVTKNKNANDNTVYLSWVFSYFV